MTSNFHVSDMSLGALITINPHENGRHVTVVTLDGIRFQSQGIAIRNPSDKADMQLGVDVASARALRRMADLLDQATGIDTK